MDYYTQFMKLIKYLSERGDAEPEWGQEESDIMKRFYEDLQNRKIMLIFMNEQFHLGSI